jgi:unsaturated rhamnogalacturonyl hydrolase
MFAYSFAKAANKGYIDKKYKAVAKNIFKGMQKYFIRTEADGTISITNCCTVAGLSADRSGTYEYYISEKFRDNDPKTTGPFIMAAIELGL